MAVRGTEISRWRAKRHSESNQALSRTQVMNRYTTASASFCGAFTVTLYYFLFKSTATLGDRNLPQHVSPRCLCRISDNGYAYSCPDVMFPSGFTTNECNMLATRQRATNYLFHTYNDNGQPVESAQRTNSFRSSSLGFKSVSAPTVNKMMSPLGITNRSLSSSKRVRSSVLSRRSEKDNRTTAPRRESLVHEKEATIDDSSTVIIIRSLDRDLSPSARLERYLISLQRAGYLTSAKKNWRENASVELIRRITKNGEITLKSKFPPHPPVYLFDRTIKDSPFDNKNRR